ncbi:MAG: DNA double-strand break repair nuclease NurA [Gemmatimonadota bacterium]|nr:DNA double-strand break repair nuclease NurA [Gemmatimonadota bacterium]
MPYEGEFAGYRALRRIADTDQVQQLLRRARRCVSGPSEFAGVVRPTPTTEDPLPEFVVAIDGSYQEVSVETGYPEARIGYVTVASVLLDLAATELLDTARPVDPVAFRETEQPATVDAALPGSNVATRTHRSAKVAFREELYDVFHGSIVDAQDGTALLDTYESLLRQREGTGRQRCPYAESGCEERIVVDEGLSTCPCLEGRPIWSTDALRIHERFRDAGTNGEAFGEVMQVWERVLLIHLLRAFERSNLLPEMHRLAFFLDGPLALFGHPAWLSAAITSELKRINRDVRRLTQWDLVIVGVEKTGAFVSHFNEIDQLDGAGAERFGNGTYCLLTDEYIKNRIIFSESPKRYGKDTYFGRKFFYKTKSGARIVASIPFLDDAQDTLVSDDVNLYPSFAVACGLVDKLVSCRYPNALAPLVSAHAQAAIPLELGARVLEQLARALMRES